MIPFLLLAIGLFLIFIEFYLPGGILGILGGLLLITAIVVFSSQYDSLILTLLFIVVTIVLVGLVVKFSLWKIRHEKKGRGIYLNSDQEGYIASQYDRTAVGKKGVAHTDLKPGGQVLVEGVKHMALSQSGYLIKGTPIVVIGGEGETLLVKKGEG